MASRGRIEVIIGPMFSSKSTTLLARVRRHEIGNRKCIVLKYLNDTRYNNESLVTHDKVEHPAVPVDDLEKVSNIVEKYDCVGIDEGQFMKNLVKYCDRWANMGKIVIVAGLDSTFQRKPFGEIPNLIAIAEKVEKLTAVCLECGEDASFSKRIVQSDELEVIGGSEAYVATCRDCFHS